MKRPPTPRRPPRRPVRAPRRRSADSRGWSTALIVVLVLGLVAVILGVAARRDRFAALSTPPLKDVDHWHAAYAFNICGEWQPSFVAFNNPEGIHAHNVTGKEEGDGFVHIHPHIDRAQGRNATMGVFLKTAGATVTASRIKLPAHSGAKAVDLSNGDKCAPLENREGRVRWTVNGKARQGDPSAYRPKDADVLAIAFLPEGVEIGKPPVAERGDIPSDLPGATPPSSAVEETTTTTSAPATTTTTSRGATTTTSRGATTTTRGATTTTTRASTTTTTSDPTTTTSAPETTTSTEARRR